MLACFHINSMIINIGIRYDGLCLCGRFFLVNLRRCAKNTTSEVIQLYVYMRKMLRLDQNLSVNIPRTLYPFYNSGLDCICLWNLVFFPDASLVHIIAHFYEFFM